MSTVQGLQIASASGATALTPEQKRFNTLIRQIEQARRTLAAWRDNVPLYLQAHTKLIVPLLEALAAARRQWIFALDGLLNQPGWNKGERATLREVVCECAAEILDGKDEPDPAIKALFDKHAEVDFDTEQQQSRLAMKGLAEAMTGLDLGDDAGIGSEQDLFRRMHEGMAAKAAAARAPEAAGLRRSKTAAQKRRETEAQLATQSIREIFRKLASALHPDREPDPAQRDAKTALMQKVNQAYAANDLLTLLELQLQIEQVDASHIANASTQRLKHYNKVLAEQLAELKAEAARAEMRFRDDFGVGFGWGMNPAKLTASIGQAARELRAELAAQQRDSRRLADKAATRRWLKAVQRHMRDDEFEDDGEFF